MINNTNDNTFNVYTNQKNNTMSMYVCTFQEVQSRPKIPVADTVSVVWALHLAVGQR